MEPRRQIHFPRTCSNDIWNSANGVERTLIKTNSFIDASFDPMRDWEGRHTAGYVVFKDKMWIVGGDPIQKHYQSDVWNSDDGKTWTRVSGAKPVPWGPRVLHYTVVFKEKSGSWADKPSAFRRPRRKCFIATSWSSADGVNWEEVAPKEPFWPQRGMIGGSVVFKDRIWILGGGTYDTPNVPKRKYFNDVWSSPGWSQLDAPS